MRSTSPRVPPETAFAEREAPRPSPRLAALLALLAPGVGHAYAGQRRRGAWRFVGESLALLPWVILWLYAGAWYSVVALFIAVPPVLVVMKFEAMRGAAALARRAPPTSPERERRWRRWALAAAAVLVALLPLAVSLRGVFDLDLERRLELANATGEWRIEEEAGRTLFEHVGGEQVELSAAPLPGGVPLWAAGPAVREQLRPPPPALERRRLGHHQVLVGRAVHGGGVTLHYLVLDPRHRDVHAFRSETEPAGAADLASKVEGLVRRTYFMRRRSDRAPSEADSDQGAPGSSQASSAAANVSPRRAAETPGDQ